MRPRTVVALAAVVLLGTAAALGVTFWRSFGSAPSAATAQGPSITSDFELTDQTGRTVRDKDFRGAWQLVFFGYTHCPDVCPTTLTDVSAALEELGPAAQKLRPLFITVDPERDTPPVLKEYLTSFDPRIVGLTGTPEQVRAALHSFRVYTSKRPGEGGDYSMDHSAFIYLMDSQGNYAAHYLSQISVEDLVGRLRERIGGAA